MTDDKLMMNGAGQEAGAPEYMAGVGEDQAFGEGMDGGSFPRLAFKGSRFRLRQGDEEIVIKENTIEVIILKDFPAISRIFFEGAYDPDGDGKPSCASADGEFPVSSLANPQSKNCATCPQNEKGSVITDDGRKSRACSFFKRLVILIKGYEEVGPIVCDVKAMSLFGDSRPGENLWSLKAYFARLKSNDVKPFHINTEMSFDTEESVPKVMFRSLSYVGEAVFTENVTPLIATPDGKLQLTQMADTSTVKFEGENSASAESFRDKLLEGDKPAHLAGPAEGNDATPEPEKTKVTEAPTIKEVVDGMKVDLAAAIKKSDYAQAAIIQAAMEKAIEDHASAPKQDSEHTKPAETQLSDQEVMDGLKLDLKLALEANDYAKAAEINEVIKARTPGASEPADEEKPLTPAQKAARTRAANKAKKLAAAEAAEKADPTGEEAEGAAEDSEGFGDELEGALKDFGF